MIVGVVGGVVSDHLLVIVNVHEPKPTFTYQVIVCPYHELLCAMAFI
jgi:hypothetical protein